MSELKRCPFCGGEAELYDYEATRDIYDSHTLGFVDTEYFTKYGVACSECNCMMAEYKSEESAIKAWNTRKPMDKTVEHLEELSDKAFDDMAIEMRHPQYFDGVGDGLDKAIEIIMEEGGL